jgi:hypothetical protein
MSEITSFDHLPIRDPSYICSGNSELSAGLDDSVCYDDWWGPVEQIKEPKNRELISSKEELHKSSQHEGPSTKHTGPPSFDDARKFLERIRMWGSAEYTGIHWTIPGKDSRRPFWRGVPVRSVEEALRQLAWTIKQTTTRDIYIALGTQRDTETKVTKAGKSFAVAWRAKENTVSFRTLFIDLDVKPGAYDTRKDAVDALKKFIVDAGLPAFSMVVASGTGGLHVYWVLDRDIPADEWYPLGLALANAGLQSGLKFDSQCSYDYTRVLRIPDTRNYKRAEPLPVELLFCDDTDIPVETMAVALEHFKGLKLAVDKKADDTASANNPLLMGLERQAQPRNIDEVAKHCGWVRESLETGGADNNNALRLLIYKMSTVCEDGDDTAWRMMSERETLTEDEFERELERAKNDVERNPKLAWPDCTTVAANGAKACQSCQYKDVGCKPLNLPPLGADATDAPEANAEGIAASLDAAVANLNKQFFGIQMGGKTKIGQYVDRDLEGDASTELVFSNRDDFFAFYSNKRTSFMGVNDDGVTVPMTETGLNFWWKHRDRLSYKGLGFDPKAGLTLPGDRLNAWRGWGVTPAQGEWALMHSHIINVLASGKREWAEYILNWLASIVQNAGVPAGVAIGWRGPKGSGKGTLGNAMQRIFGEQGVTVRTPKHLVGNFNGHMLGKTLAFVDEGYWAGDKQHEGVLKGLITEPNMMLEMKGVDAFMTPNRLSIMIAANADWIVPATEDERRFAIFDCADTYTVKKVGAVASRAYFGKIIAEMNNGGLGAMLYDLLNRDISKFNIQDVPDTPALQDQKLLGLELTDRWWFECLNAAELPLTFTQKKDNHPQNYPNFAYSEAIRDDMKACETRGCRMAEGRLEKFLRDPKKCGAIKSKDKLRRKRGWKFPPLAQCRSQWEKRFGPQDWDTEAEDWLSQHGENPDSDGTEDFDAAATLERVAKLL